MNDVVEIHEASGAPTASVLADLDTEACAELRGLGLNVHRALARQAFAQLVTSARFWYAADSEADDVAQRLRHTKRAVQRVIDLMHEDDACILGLACTGAGGGDLAAHAARVCVLALAVARHAAHARADLQTVGLAALLGDVGVGTPAPEGAHTAAAPAAWRGATRLLETLPAETAVPAALAALASAAGAASGEAAAEAPPPHASALASLVRIADLYDQIVRHAFPAACVRPDAAVHFVFHHAARAIDTVLAQRFAAVLGVFPPGSVVRLDSGETAVVIRANMANVDRPQVLLVLDASGAPLDGTVCVDLAVRSREGTTPTITQALDPGEAGIEPLAWFLADPRT